MKKLFPVVLLTGCLAIPSFAGDVVGHSAKVVGKDSVKVGTVTGKDSAKVVTVTAKKSAKAVVAVGKRLF